MFRTFSRPQSKKPVKRNEPTEQNVQKENLDANVDEKLDLNFGENFNKKDQWKSRDHEAMNEAHNDDPFMVGLQNQFPGAGDNYGNNDD